VKSKKQIKNIKAKLVRSPEQALDTCISIFKSDAFLVLQSQLLPAKKQFNLGILPVKEFLQIQSKVVYGVLETLRDLEKEIKKNLFYQKKSLFSNTNS